MWKYPVTFDYLPVYRLAKVLHLTAFSEHKNPCFSHSCHRNERCQQLMNNRSEHICLCPVNFTGDNCSSKDQRICLGLAVFRPPLFIEDAYPRRISLPSWVKRCIKFFRKARFSFSIYPIHPQGEVRENRNIFSHARDLVFMQLIRASNADSILPWESNLACSKGELWRHGDRPIWSTIESP